MITLEIELNQNCNLKFKQLERVTLGLNMGDRAVDINVQKTSPNSSVEQDAANNMLLWQVANLHQDESATLTFSSEKLSFEDIFPIDVRFEETYSIIELDVQEVTSQDSGDPLSVKTIHSLATDSYRISE